MTATAYETSRQLDKNFYVDDTNRDTYIKQRMDESYNQFISQTQAFWNEARIDQRFLAGDQSLWNEIYTDIPATSRKQFNFNKIRRIVNMIGGHQRKHRKATNIQPIEGADEETANQFSDVIAWAYQRDNVYNTISDAFEHGSLTTGLSLLGVWLDNTFDPASGDLKVNHYAYNSYMMDTFFRKQDLSDCSFIWTRKWFTKEECMLLLPERSKEIEDMKIPRYGNKDQKFYFMPENYNFTTRNLLPYDEYWYMDTRKQKLLIDTQTGEVMEWTSEDKERLDLFLATYPTIKVKNVTIPTVKLAISINGKVMYDGKNPLGIDRYPFVPVLGYWDPDNVYFSGRLQGVVRGLRDAQFLYNRRKVIELDILESQINSGMKVMEGSLVDNNDVLKSGQGQPIFIKQTAPLGMESVQQLQSPQIPPTTIQLSEILSKEIQEISGVNEELLGSADDDKAGILSMLRQGAGLVTLQRLFDQLDLSQKILGEISMEIIQKNFTYGKIQRILGKEPTDQFQNKAFQKYDCVIAEGLLTDTQQKLEFLQYSNLTQMGLPIPPDILIDKAPVQGKKELKEAVMKQFEQQQQQQQRTAELENQMVEANIWEKKGLGAERFSRIEENKMLAEERRAEAIKDLNLATYHEVEAAKSLDEIDLNNLQKLIEIVQTLKGQKEGEMETSKSKETVSQGANV